jgi:hypothetical protein
MGPKYSRTSKRDKVKNTADLCRHCFTHCDYCGELFGAATFHLLAYQDDGRGKPFYVVHDDCLDELKERWWGRAA